MFLGYYGASPGKAGPLEVTNGPANFLPGSFAPGKLSAAGDPFRRLNSLYYVSLLTSRLPGVKFCTL